jgi:hypothetical protein
MTAAHRAIDITKVLEQILLSLHYTDLADCLKVSKYFDAVINRSSTLRNTL